MDPALYCYWIKFALGCPIGKKISKLLKVLKKMLFPVRWRVCEEICTGILGAGSLSSMETMGNSFTSVIPSFRTPLHQKTDYQVFMLMID